MTTPALYCRTHDSYYQPPRCSPLCTLLETWSEPVRDVEAESRQRETQESGKQCREAHMRFGGGNT